MKRGILLIFILFFITGCGAVNLRKTVEEKSIFKEKKDKYSINIYKIKYPSEIKEKEKFFKDFDVYVKRALLYKSKHLLGIDSEFKKDIDIIKNDGMLNGEEIFLKPASTMNEIEIKKLYEFFNKKVPLKYTIQDILDVQVEYLLLVLNTFDEKQTAAVKKEFPENYSELMKEVIVKRIKDFRAATVRVLEKTSIEMVYIYDAALEKKEDISNIGIFPLNDMVLDKRKSYAEFINSLKMNIVFMGLTEDEERKIFSDRDSYDNKILLMYSKKYSGFAGNKSGGKIIAANGSEALFSGQKIAFALKISSVELAELIKYGDTVLLKDL